MAVTITGMSIITEATMLVDCSQTGTGPPMSCSRPAHPLKRAKVQKPTTAR